MTPEEIVEFAEGLARVAASGGGAQALAAYFADRAEIGVLIEDARWSHLAAVGRFAIPASARELFAPHDADTRGAHVHSNGQPGSTLAILAGTSHVGWISIFADHAHRVAELGMPLRLTASAIGVELSRSSGRSGSTRQSFWERLLMGAYSDVGSARDSAAAGGITLAPQYLVVAVETDRREDVLPSDDMTHARSIIGTLLHSDETTFGTVERGETLLTLVPILREVDADNARTSAKLFPKTFAKRAPGRALCGGIGTVEPLLQTRRSLENAEAAMHIARRLYGLGNVCAYEELGAYPLLYGGASPTSLREFASRVLAPLRTYDEKHQTELVRTLQIYFDKGQNVKIASAFLCVHRHTVFYRLRQIGEIAHASLESAHDQLTLRLAIAIDALHT